MIFLPYYKCGRKIVIDWIGKLSQKTVDFYEMYKKFIEKSIFCS